jgi:DNA-binding MarR family transcriptional regulator
LVERLVREGLVERATTAEDGRGAYAILTEVGRARLAEAQATHIASVRTRFLDHFNAEELALLSAWWRRVQYADENTISEHPSNS